MSIVENQNTSCDKLQQLQQELQQALIEVLSSSKFSHIIKEYRLSGAVEVQIVLNTAKISLKDNLPAQEVLTSALQEIAAPQVLLASSRQRCPCRPGDLPDDCCWVS